nr:MAG TPA: hypothetical protein [Caudoviricetes sp.]
MYGRDQQAGCIRWIPSSICCTSPSCNNCIVTCDTR